MTNVGLLSTLSLGVITFFLAVLLRELVCVRHTCLSIYAYFGKIHEIDDDIVFWQKLA